MKAALSVTLALVAAGCALFNGPELRHVVGTVRQSNVEGSFFYIRGDDSVSYTPTNPLPSCYAKDGLRIDVVLKIEKNVVTYTPGTPVEVQRINSPTNMTCGL